MDKRALDLYTLHKHVHDEGWLNSIKFNGSYSNFEGVPGGMEIVTRERKWTGIANRLGLKSNNHKGIGSILRTHYERIIYPFVVFQTGKNKRVSVENGKIKLEEEDIKDKDYVPHHIPSRMAVKPPPPSKLYS